MSKFEYIKLSKDSIMKTYYPIGNINLEIAFQLKKIGDSLERIESYLTSLFDKKEVGK